MNGSRSDFRVSDLFIRQLLMVMIDASENRNADLADKYRRLKMPAFRFAVMGAGKIAHKFCEAAAMIPECTVCAVASKSRDRAEKFAAERGIDAAYDSYEQLLEKEKPDAVYIATTCDSHFELSMLCLKYRVPVLCEKAMFTGSAEAESYFHAAEDLRVFSMEALWSRFLPAVNQARQWVQEGRIGKIAAAEMGIGFAAEPDPGNRYFNPRLGGGAANDLTVYGLQLLTWVLSRPITRAHAEAVPASTGVDISSMVLLRLGEDVPAAVKSSLMASVDEVLVIYGSEGKILVPHAHYAEEAMLLDVNGKTTTHFRDENTRNGFTYEIEEVMRCVRERRTESPVVPHADTLACAKVFDLIRGSMGQA